VGDGGRATWNSFCALQQKCHLKQEKNLPAGKQAANNQESDIPPAMVLEKEIWEYIKIKVSISDTNLLELFEDSS